MLTHDPQHNLFVWRGAFETRGIPRKAGFSWSDTAKCWYAASPYLAYKLRRYADASTKLKLLSIGMRIEGSAATEPLLYDPRGLYPFQAAGVEYMARVMRGGRSYVMLADDPGLGKTPQAVRLATDLGFKKLLVICPASLRLNWVREIKTWSGEDAQAFVTGAQPLDYGRSIVTSYALADKLKAFKPEFVVVDECFTGLTQVLTPQGKRRIKDIRVGDEVLNAFGVSKVTRVFSKTVSTIMQLHLENGAVINTTPSHKIFTTEGWCLAKDTLDKKLLDYADVHGVVSQYNNERTSYEKVLRKLWHRIRSFWMDSEDTKVLFKKMLIRRSSSESAQKPSSYSNLRYLWERVFGYRRKSRKSNCVRPILRGKERGFRQPHPDDGDAVFGMWRAILRIRRSKTQKETLFSELLGEMENETARAKEEVAQTLERQRKTVGHDEKDASRQPSRGRVEFGAYENKKPNKFTGGGGENPKHKTVEWNSTRAASEAWWKWAANGGTPKDIIRASVEVRQPMGGGAPYTDRKTPWKWLSYMLQSRLSHTRNVFFCGSRWRFSPFSKTTRRKKDEITFGTRVERVESVEQRSYRKHGRDCEKGIEVYDLTVTGHPSYYANGFLVHNCHNVKNPGAQRTKLILGDYKQNWRGLVADTPAIFLSGTPLPNGRPNELYPILRRCAPDAIGNLGYYPFLNRYCTFVDNDIGGPVILGAKNRRELFIRLRGSGFMTRRLKKDVLKDLPPKRFKLVVFSPTREAQSVLHREREFSAKEIIEHGVPVGTALPELRKEMGIAKVPQAAEYVGDLLDSGVKKAVLFCHHIEVVAQLAARLKEYGVVTIVGSTSSTARQAAVDAFQTDRSVRVFIGNKAAEEGITLTRAQDVVLVEPSWSPGEENQRADRLHRIGQTGPVLVHILVVEGSLDAKIMASAADKRDDIQAVIDGAYRLSAEPLF